MPDPSTTTAPMPALPPNPDAPGHLARAPDATTQLTRRLALLALTLLIGLGLAWELWLAPTGQGTWALKVLPLVPAWLGLWRFRMFTYRWLSLLLWLYFTEGVVRGATESGLSAALAWGQVLLSLLLFGACAWHIRWRLSRAAA